MKLVSYLLAGLLAAALAAFAQPFTVSAVTITSSHLTGACPNQTFDVQADLVPAGTIQGETSTKGGPPRKAPTSLVVFHWASGTGDSPDEQFGISTSKATRTYSHPVAPGTAGWAQLVVTTPNSISSPRLAKLLQQTAALKLYVVGHTDSVGTLASNMDLSKRRADAVVQALTTKYGVAAARLTAQGCGPLAPVASNDTEDGRTKNRRVELVKQ